MPLHSDNLYTMIGRVKDARPNLGEEQYRTYINDAIRKVINMRTYWTDLRQKGIIAVPDGYSEGTITTVNGDNKVYGAGTAWPVNDVVNTTLGEPVTDIGNTEIQLASVAGITLDSVLWVDGGTANAEAIPVYRINKFNGTANATIVTKFQYPHPLGATVTQSSLVSRQWRAGYNYPIFTVWAVIDATTILLDDYWGGPAITAAEYQILKMYYTLFPNIRKIIAVVDEQQGVPLDTRKTQEELNVTDPQRTDNSDPLCFVSAWKNVNMNAFWEIWPAPTSARQISVLASLQWPEMISGEDLPPPFLEPTIFTDMATARALRIRRAAQDPFFDPKLAAEFESSAKAMVVDALNGDEDRAIQDYKNQLGSMLPGIGANSQFALSHTVEQLMWEF